MTDAHPSFTMPSFTMPSFTMPSFTMIVSTFQRRDMVCETVQTIGKIQYDGPFELVVIIDGSQDGTEEALRKIELPFPYRVVWQPNGGLGHARNRGAAEARNDILFFLDDDMICMADIVEQHAKMYREGADAVVGDIPLDGKSPPGFLTDGIAAWSATVIRETAAHHKLQPTHIFGGHLSIRRTVFEAIGGFDESFTANGNYGQEDADLGVRLLARYDVRFNPRAISLHRYIVTPFEHMQRAYKSGRADVKLVAKHPELADQVFSLRRQNAPMVRFVIRPLARVPLLPRIIAAFGWRFADIVLRTRFRHSPTLARFYYGSQLTAYWASVAHHSGKARP